MTKKEQLLIITYYMIPYCPTFGNCQRMFFLADTLSKKFDVTIIHFKETEFNLLGQNMSYKSLVFDIKNKFINRFLYRRKSYYLPNSDINQQVIESNFNRFFKNIIKKIYCFFLLEIHNSLSLKAKVWINYIKPDILSFIKKNNIENVIISGPPFALFDAVDFIKKKNRDINVILDYRDPWSMYFNESSFIIKAREKKYLSLSNNIIVFSQEFADDLMSNFKINPTKITLIRNGYSLKNWNKISNKPDNPQITTLNISYVGSIKIALDGHSNPFPLFEAIKDLSDFSDFSLNLIGLSNEDLSLQDQIKKQYDQKINFYGKLSAQESLQKMSVSDVLLIIHDAPDDNSSRYIYPGKYYDYLKSGKFILFIGNGNSLLKRDIEKYNLGLCCFNDKNEIKKALVNVLDLKNSGKLNEFKHDFLDVDIFSREFQNNKIFNILI